MEGKDKCDGYYGSGVRAGVTDITSAQSGMNGEDIPYRWIIEERSPSQRMSLWLRDGLFWLSGEG